MASEVLSNTPCEGCVTVVPSAKHEGPRPLLVLLHGDGGEVNKIVRPFRRACDDAQVVILAPRCPRNLGCQTASFWQWQASLDHDPAFLDSQIEATMERLPIDQDRIYAAGFSGGATYLGWYVPLNPNRFAAVAHLGGGARYRVPCPACKVPVLFLIGSVDPMLDPYTRPLRQFYEGCGGHELQWEQLRGVGHEPLLSVLEQGRAKDVLGFLLTHRGTCGTVDAVDGKPPPVPLATSSEAKAPEAAPTSIRSDPGPPTPPRTVEPPANGCACRRTAQVATANHHPGAGLVLLTLSLFFRRSSRRSSPRRPASRS